MLVPREHVTSIHRPALEFEVVFSQSFHQCAGVFHWQHHAQGIIFERAKLMTRIPRRKS